MWYIFYIKGGEINVYEWHITSDGNERKEDDVIVWHGSYGKELLIESIYLFICWILHQM